MAWPSVSDHLLLHFTVAGRWESSPAWAAADNPVCSERSGACLVWTHACISVGCVRECSWWFEWPPGRMCHLSRQRQTATLPPAEYESPGCPESCPHLNNCSCLGGCYESCVTGLIFISPIAKEVEKHAPVFLGHSEIPFRKESAVRVSCPLFCWVICLFLMLLGYSSYITDPNLLLDL